MGPPRYPLKLSEKICVFREILQKSLNLAKILQIYGCNSLSKHLLAANEATVELSGLPRVAVQTVHKSINMTHNYCVRISELPNQIACTSSSCSVSLFNSLSENRWKPRRRSNTDAIFNHDYIILHCRILRVHDILNSMFCTFSAPALFKSRSGTSGSQSHSHSACVGGLHRLC